MSFRERLRNYRGLYWWDANTDAYIHPVWMVVGGVLIMTGLSLVAGRVQSDIPLIGAFWDIPLALGMCVVGVFCWFMAGADRRTLEYKWWYREDFYPRTCKEIDHRALRRAHRQVAKEKCGRGCSFHEVAKVFDDMWGKRPPFSPLEIRLVEIYEQEAWVRRPV